MLASQYLLIYITRYLESFHFLLRQQVNTHRHTSYTVLIGIHHTLFGIFPFAVKTAGKYTQSQYLLIYLTRYLESFQFE